MEIKYRYNEREILNNLEAYIESTYAQHYAKGKEQTMQHIIDAGHGEGFALGSIIKYASRYGKKNGKNPHDLMKLIHYAIIAIYIADSEGKDKCG